MPDGYQGHWLSYRELAMMLGCTTNAARMHAVRRKWPRRASNRIGEPAHVLVPEDVVVRGRAMRVGEQLNALCNEQCDAAVQANGRATSDAQDNTALAIRALESAIEGLREQLAVTNERAERADRRLEGLQAALDAKSRELAAMRLTETPPAAALLVQLADNNEVIDDLRRRLDEKRAKLTTARIEVAEVRGRLAALEAEQTKSPARRSWWLWRK